MATVDEYMKIAHNNLDKAADLFRCRSYEGGLLHSQDGQVSLLCACTLMIAGYVPEDKEDLNLTPLSNLLALIKKSGGPAPENLFKTCDRMDTLYSKLRMNSKSFLDDTIVNVVQKASRELLAYHTGLVTYTYPVTSTTSRLTLDAIIFGLDLGFKHKGRALTCALEGNMLGYLKEFAESARVNMETVLNINDKAVAKETLDNYERELFYLDIDLGLDRNEFPLFDLIRSHSEDETLQWTTRRTGILVHMCNEIIVVTTNYLNLMTYKLVEESYKRDRFMESSSSFKKEKGGI